MQTLTNSNATITVNNFVITGGDYMESIRIIHEINGFVDINQMYNINCSDYVLFSPIIFGLLDLKHQRMLKNFICSGTVTEQFRKGVQFSFGTDRGSDTVLVNEINWEKGGDTVSKRLEWDEFQKWILDHLWK